MSRPLRIMHVLLSLQPGGLENGVVNVVNGLDDRRFSSSVCCLKDAGAFAARLKPGVEVTAMGLRGGNDVSLPWRLARLFRRTRPDIVHTRNAEAYFYGFAGAWLAGVPNVIHSEHGRTFDDRALRFHLQRWLSARTAAIFTVSAQLKRDLVRHVGMPAAAVQVLHNGVDTTGFGGGERAAARAALGLAPHALVLGSVGRLVPVKNYALLIEVLAALPQTDACLLLIGDGPQRSALEALARSHGVAGRVRFAGHRDDIGALLPALDVFVLPSKSEGMSNTLLEAMAAGVACIASDVGGNPEILAEDCGLLFASGDATALHQAIALLCQDPALRLRLAYSGQQRVRAEFSLPAMVARYEALYAAIGAGARTGTLAAASPGTSNATSTGTGMEKIG